jgi:hypothetical protein
MTISNFEYDEVNKDIYFEFSGTVFNEYDETDTRIVSGVYDIKNHLDIACSVNVLTSLNYKSDEFEFNSINGSRKTTFSDGTYRHRFFSNNGYRIDFHIDDDMTQLALGSYLLTENSTTAFLKLYEYVSPINAVQYPLFSQIIWNEYTTKDQFVITENVLINGENKVSGYFDIEVLDQNQVIYTADRMEFVRN